MGKRLLVIYIVFVHAILVMVVLIVSWPARWKGNQRRTGACSMVDLVQTIAELGGASVPGDWNGTSMCRWMDEPATMWKERAVSEYYAHNVASGFAMLRTGRYKYVYHAAADVKHSAQRELYDLDADPGEFNNLSGLAQYQETIRRFHAALVKELGEDPEQTEKRCRVEIAKGYDNGGKAMKNVISASSVLAAARYRASRKAWSFGGTSREVRWPGT
jgi:choline-sulfatase